MSDTKPQAHPDVVAYRRPDAGTHPPLLYPDYALDGAARAARAARLAAAHARPRSPGRCSASGRLGELDHDLTRQHDGEPLGERIIVHGRVLDGDGRPVAEHARRDLAGERGAGATATTATSTPRRSTRTSPASGAA